jgi:hypothetical protein
MAFVFRYILLLPDHQSNDPPCLVTPVPDPPVGGEIELANGTRALVLERDTAVHSHMRALGFSGVLTVEPI